MDTPDEETVPHIVVGRDYFRRYLEHNTYLDIKSIESVGKDEIKIVWVGALVKPTTLKVTG